jgi:hypothetical protein
VEHQAKRYVNLQRIAGLAQLLQMRGMREDAIKRAMVQQGAACHASGKVNQPIPSHVADICFQSSSF